MFPKPRTYHRPPKQKFEVQEQTHTCPSLSAGLGARLPLLATVCHSPSPVRPPPPPPYPSPPEEAEEEGERRSSTMPPAPLDTALSSLDLLAMHPPAAAPAAAAAALARSLALPRMCAWGQKALDRHLLP